VICVVDASVAVKWFVNADWALREDHLEPALDVLRASSQGTVELWQPPHFLAEVAAVLTRLKPDDAPTDIELLAALDIRWAQPTDACAQAMALARQLDHHLFDTLYHALALGLPGATLVTADRRYFDKARHLGGITWLPDWRSA
jgi:predicted nucleic acid-binding protein